MTVASSAAGAAWDTAFIFEGILYPGPQAMELLKPADVVGGRWEYFGSSASTVDADHLVWTCSAYSGSAARAGRSVQSGKWYWEQAAEHLDTSGTANTNAVNLGVWPISRPMNTYIYNTTGVRRVYPDVAVGDVIRCAFDADAGILSIYRNATLLGGVVGQPLSMSEPWAPVIGDDNAGGARFRANFGASPFAFSPPAGFLPLASGGSGVGSRPIRAAVGAMTIAASAPVPNFSTRTSSLATARDVEYGGPGTIYGTTKNKGTSDNTPIKARAVLLHQRSKLPFRETWSDPVTGAFVFTGIDTRQQFLVVAEDADGHFRPVAANRLTPEVL